MTPPLPARQPIRRLIGALDRKDVRYCHWKSNIRLADSLAGAGDLDLLVDRRHASPFLSALTESGFKLTASRAGSGHPGVLHAFALDPDRAKLVHVHAYFQIVTGDSLVKGFHLPFEEVLLVRTRRMFGVAVPAVEAELVLFTLRIALKHTRFTELLLVRRYYGAVCDELKWLHAAADAHAVEALWRAWLPGAPVTLFHELMVAIAEPGALVWRILLGRRLARHLRGWRRLDPFAATASRLRRLIELVMNRFTHRRGSTPLAAGVIIAFVGPKATGKSTLSTAMAQRLGQHLQVRHVHVGKPPATAVTLLARLMLPLARRLFPGERSREYDDLERRRDVRYSLLHVLRLTVLAYERRALLRRCWRDAAAGSIVVADRYPSASIGAADSSRFDHTALAQCGSWLKRWLMKRERALYTGLPPPGLVIRLSAPIETTVRRDAERDKKEGPDSAAVVRRRQSETEADFAGVRVIAVDTDQPLEASLKEAMHAIWTAI